MTIARPQFSELIAQPYVDIESNRFYRGNPFLKDSELWNADVRGEWYMGRDERLTAAAFYKKIDNPIETYTTINDSYAVTSSFANAPEATLYGAEIRSEEHTSELQSLMRISYAVFCLKKKKKQQQGSKITQ